MMERNLIKDKLAAGRPVLGTWSTLASPLVVEVLAHAGLDFVILDYEHGPFQLGTAHESVVRCERHGCAAIVRVPTHEPWMILQALDQGAQGVMVPHMDQATDVHAFVEAAKYPPLGQRGFSPFPRAGGFTNRQAAHYPEQANRLTLTAIIVESFKGLEELERIVEVPNLDVVYFGAYDLSKEAGVPGDLFHPKVLTPIVAGVHTVMQAGKFAGGMVASSSDEVQRLLDLGMRFITYDVDSAALFRPMQDMVAWLEKTWKA